MRLVEELLDFKLDVCLIGVLFPYNKRIRLYRIPTDEPLVFLASPEYPLPNDTPMKWIELSSHPLIIQPEGSASRAIVLHHFMKREVKAIGHIRPRTYHDRYLITANGLPIIPVT